MCDFDASTIFHRGLLKFPQLCIIINLESVAAGIFTGILCHRRQSLSLFLGRTSLYRKPFGRRHGACGNGPGRGMSGLAGWIDGRPRRGGQPIVVGLCGLSMKSPQSSDRGDRARTTGVPAMRPRSAFWPDVHDLRFSQHFRIQLNDRKRYGTSFPIYVRWFSHLCATLPP